MTDVRNILLIRTDRLGDLVLTLPMLPVLKRRFPRARVTMLVGQYPSEILTDNAYVDEVILYDRGSSLAAFHDILSHVRSRAFDTAIVVHPTFRLALLVFLARIPNRIGTGYRWYSFLFNRRVYEHRKDARRHEAEYNLNLLSALDVPPTKPAEFPISIPASSVTRVKNLLEHHRISEDDLVVILHPGSGGSARDWSPRNFGELSLRLRSELDATVILTGAKGEDAVVAEVQRHGSPDAINVVGRLSLLDLVALIDRTDLFVANSTGPLHIAAALGKRVIGIYPPIPQCTPTRWGPYTEKKKVFVPDRNLCSLCQGRECEASECMDQITVGEVFEAARELLRSDERGANRESHAQKAAL
jgi:heptosyltransferase-3